MNRRVARELKDVITPHREHQRPDADSGRHESATAGVVRVNDMRLELLRKLSDLPDFEEHTQTIAAGQVTDIDTLDFIRRVKRR